MEQIFYCLLYPFVITSHCFVVFPLLLLLELWGQQRPKLTGFVCGCSGGTVYSHIQKNFASRETSRAEPEYEYTAPPPPPPQLMF